MKTLTKKEIKKVHTYLRAIIQLIFFILIPSAYTAAFSGIKYIFNQIGLGTQIELTSFLTILISLCIFTIIFGRFFCGFACAFGTLGDAIHAIYIWVCKKAKKKPIKLAPKWTRELSKLKYLLLVIIVLMCNFKVYSYAKGTSPWDVFSMIHAGNFNFTGYTIGIVLLILIVIGMAIQERFFCRFLCPMGAIFSLLPILPFLALRRSRKDCIRGCSFCSRNCPSEISLSEDGSLETAGNCFQCQKCIDNCPKGNVHCGMKVLNGNEVFFTIFRAALLMALLYYVGA